jgi:hypothetical protein
LEVNAKASGAGAAETGVGSIGVDAGVEAVEPAELAKLPDRDLGVPSKEESSKLVVDLREPSDADRGIPEYKEDELLGGGPAIECAGVSGGRTGADPAVVGPDGAVTRSPEEYDDDVIAGVRAFPIRRLNPEATARASPIKRAGPLLGGFNFRTLPKSLP